MGRRTKDRNFWDCAMMNNATYIQYYNRLTELAISMFEWINLPEEIDPRFLELVLFAKGKAVFFKDPELGYMALMVTDMGPMNPYRIPLRRRAYASNGYNAELTINDSVMIYNNYLRTPSKLDVEMFSRRLYNIDRTIDINVNGQKTPLMIQCDETQRLTLENLFMQYDGNKPVIYGDTALQNNPIKAIVTGVPYIAGELTTLKTQYWNEALTYLGISNVNIQKKERLINDEVARNMGGVISSRYSRLNARRDACEEINKMFGLNVSVEYRDDIRLQDNDLLDKGETGNDETYMMFGEVENNE